MKLRLQHNTKFLTEKMVKITRRILTTSIPQINEYITVNYNETSDLLILTLSIQHKSEIICLEKETFSDVEKLLISQTLNLLVLRYLYYA